YAPEMEKVETRMRQVWQKMPPGSPSGPFAGMPGAMKEAAPLEPSRPVHRPSEHAAVTAKKPQEILKPRGLMKIQFQKQHAIQAFPSYGGGLDYTNSTFVFSSGPVIQTLRPLEQHGELNVYSFVTGKTKRLLVPQPAGFRPKYAWLPYFQNPVLA